MKPKVTMQDIANKLGLSRNTVFKALNNKGSLSEKTKQKVINTAIEMGYREFAYKNLDKKIQLLKKLHYLQKLCQIVLILLQNY